MPSDKPYESSGVQVCLKRRGTNALLVWNQTHRVRSQPQSGCSARPVGLERVTVTRGPIGQFTVGCLAGARGALEDSRRQGTTDVAPEGPVQIARARKPFEGERA